MKRKKYKMNKIGPGLSVTFFNRGHIYLQEMIDLFLDNDKKESKEVLYNLVNFYIEKQFSNNYEKITEFLYFQDKNSLLENYYYNEKVSEFGLLHTALLCSLKESIKLFI